MGTRGWYVFKYNGNYYVYYNHFDSYPNYLGKLIYKQITDLIKENNYSPESFNVLKEYIIKIEEPDEKRMGDENFTSLINSVKMPALYDYHITSIEPDCTVFIEYVYIIDLDDNQFIVKSSEIQFKCHIFNIPQTWYKPFNYDDE